MSPVAPASSLLGHPVFNSEGEKVGVIKDLVFETDHGAIAYAVMRCEGNTKGEGNIFTIPYNSLNIYPDTDRVLLDVAKEVLVNTPGLDEYGT